MESGLCVSLHLLSLANTFIVQSGPAHEEAGSGCVSERARFHTVVTWSRAPYTSNRPPVGSWGLPPCLRNPKAGSKASCQKEENSNWMNFQVVARPHHTRAPREKNMNFAPLGPVSSLTHRVCPCRIQECSRQSYSLNLSCRGNMMEKTFGCCLDFPCDCGSPP